jgi:transcriptional regulator with XRE-family HTH domain
MGSVVICASPKNLSRAGQFAKKTLREAELCTFADVFRDVPIANVLVYLTHPDYEHVRGLLKALKPNAPDVVIYYAKRPAPEEAAELGRLVGELRPRHTSLFFDAKAAIASVLRDPDHDAESRVRLLRRRFGLTQTELAHALGLSLRTVQNWEGKDAAVKGHRVRDLEELRDVLAAAIADPDIPVWLRSENKAFRGIRPIDLLIEGKSRDILAEFRRLQAGEPI